MYSGQAFLYIYIHNGSLLVEALPLRRQYFMPTTRSSSVTFLKDLYNSNQLLPHIRHPSVSRCPFCLISPPLSSGSGGCTDDGIDQRIGKAKQSDEGRRTRQETGESREKAPFLTRAFQPFSSLEFMCFYQKV